MRLTRRAGLCTQDAQEPSFKIPPKDLEEFMHASYKPGCFVYTQVYIHVHVYSQAMKYGTDHCTVWRKYRITSTATVGRNWEGQYLFNS